MRRQVLDPMVVRSLVQTINKCSQILFITDSLKMRFESYIPAEEEEIWRCGQHDEYSNYVLNLGETGESEEWHEEHQQTGAQEHDTRGRCHLHSKYGT
jgi:hypothetical protein